MKSVKLLSILLFHGALAVDLAFMSRQKATKSVNSDASDAMPDSSKWVLSEHRKYYLSDPNPEDSFPDVPIYIPEGFAQNTFPLNMTDCWVIDANHSMAVCDTQDWEDINLDQFPDTLTYLLVNGTNITDFGPEIFQGKEILYLDIADHDIGSFHVDTFVGLEYVQAIRIRDSGWDNVQDNPEHAFLEMFHYNTEVTQLILENNNLIIEDVDKTIKSNQTILPNLSYLSLKKNPLGRIEEYFFWNLRESNLTHLNLHSCDLHSIAERAFASLSSLQHVDFYNNKLLVLPQLTLPLTFANLNPEQFNNLGLGNVGLRLLPSLITYSLRKGLQRLNLSENKLPDLGSLAGVLSTDAFPQMDKMKELVLVATTLTDVHERTFEHLPNLEKLDLRNNELMNIQRGFLHSNLNELDISYQCIMSGHKCNPTVEHGSVYFTLNPRVFNQDMQKLKILRMSGLQMEQMNNESFIGLDGLEILDLDNSDLIKIEPGVFEAVPGLIYLDLSWNRQLTKVTKDTFRGLNKLEVLDLSFSSHAFNDGGFKPVKTVDQRLETILDMRSIKELYLTCALNGDCKGDYVYESPLNASLLEEFRDLEVLDLSDNALTSWTDDRFIQNKKLRSLNLAKNSFVFITPGMIESFRRLDWLDFSGNPVSCDDRVMDFHKMVESTPSLSVNRYKNGYGYICTMTDKNFETLSYREYTQWIETHTGSGIVEPLVGGLVGLLIIVVVLGGVSYHRRYQIAYFYLKTRKKLKEQRNPDMEYEFDVFVSYCQDEKNWVLEELVPQLESGTPSLSVCIHEKHFKVGTPVIENINDFIDKSRTFMIVLSHGFAQSKWCEFEAKLAQSKMLSHKRNLLVVVKERPQSSELGRTLKFILDTWTYISWPSGPNPSETKVKEFYDKLRLSVYKAIGQCESECSTSHVIQMDSADFLSPESARKKPCS